MNALDWDTAVLVSMYLPKRTVKAMVTIKRSQSLTILLNVDLLSVESCAQWRCYSRLLSSCRRIRSIRWGLHNVSQDILKWHRKINEMWFHYGQNSEKPPFSRLRQLLVLDPEKSHIW